MSIVNSGTPAVRGFTHRVRGGASYGTTEAPSLNWLDANDGARAPHEQVRNAATQPCTQATESRFEPAIRSERIGRADT
jgi:hypothetical protein